MHHRKTAAHATSPHAHTCCGSTIVKPRRRQWRLSAPLARLLSNGQRRYIREYRSDLLCADVHSATISQIAEASARLERIPLFSSFDRGHARAVWRHLTNTLGAAVFTSGSVSARLVGGRLCDRMVVRESSRMLCVQSILVDMADQLLEACNESWMRTLAIAGRDNLRTINKLRATVRNCLMATLPTFDGWRECLGQFLEVHKSLYDGDVANTAFADIAIMTLADARERLDRHLVKTVLDFCRDDVIWSH